MTLLFTAVTVFRISAAQIDNFEMSDPYLELIVDKFNVKPGEELTYLIKFSNRGPQPAKDLTIILNQPLDARSPLEFVSADPEPVEWLSSEYGNLPKFSVSLLETFEATEAGIIRVTTLVRDSAIPQSISPTASIQAPNREIGKQLVVSEAAVTKILKSDQVKGSQEGNLDETLEKQDNQQELSLNDSKTSLRDQKSKTQSILASDAVVSSVAFLGISSLIIVAFFAGRKSKTK